MRARLIIGTIPVASFPSCLRTSHSFSSRFCKTDHLQASRPGFLHHLLVLSRRASLATTVAAMAPQALPNSPNGGKFSYSLFEMWNCPYSNNSFPTYAEDIDAGLEASPSTAMLAEVARKKKVTIVAGSIPERSGGNLYNTCCVFDKNGELKAKFRKIHLFDIDIPGKITFKESDMLTPGEELCVVDTDVGQIAVGICYDIRFPKVGWMGAGPPRTPLRALIARESSDGSFRTLSQTNDSPTPLLTKSLLWARARGEDAGSAHKSAASSGRRSGSCKVKGRSPSSTTPPPSSGCSSPSTRLGHTSHKMRAATSNCMAEFLRPVQLGALFAQERENQTRTSRTLADHGGQPPLRDLIAAELAGTCMAPGVGFLPHVATSPGNRNSKGNHADCRQPPDLESSQELRYLFAKDWALQTSDEDDEFWDSGSLCGLASPSPSPRWSGHDQRRRRMKKRHSKLRHSSSSSHCTPAAARPRTQRSPPFPTPTPTPTSIASLHEIHAHSPGHGRFIPKDAAPCGQGPKSSLGSLLAEEKIAATSSLEATWSAPSQSSRRPKIGSLSDISAPVRPESQSQLDFLIAKILTLRANSMEAKSSNATSAGEPADDGGCSTSGSDMQGTAADIVRVAEDEDLVCAATDSSSSSSSSAAAAAAAEPATGTDVNLSIVDAPIVTNPPIPDIGEAPDSLHSTRQEPHSSVGETIDSPSTAVTDAGETALQHEGDHVGYDEPAEDMARSSSEVEAPAPERVQLGTLLERTREEHGWIPLGQSWMLASPLSLVVSQQPPASSSTSSQFNKVSTDDTCHHSSARELVVSPRSSPGSPRSPELGAFQQAAADPPPESTTGTERASSTTTAAAATASVVVDAGSAMREQQRPPTQRVSLLSLLNQDMEMDLEDGLHLMLCGGGCRPDEEEPEEPADTEELDPMCCVCMVGHKGAAFIPCGHTFCRRCCREVHRSIGSCPLCNQVIADVLKLY